MERSDRDIGAVTGASISLKIVGGNGEAVHESCIYVFCSFD